MAGSYYGSATSMAASTNHFSSSATAFSNGLVWTNWVSVTNSASTTADSLWLAWNYQGTSNTPTIAVPRRTAAEIEAEKQRWAEQKRKADEAAQRADALLREHLSKEQEQSLDRNGRFRVRGSKGGIFDICRGNVIELDPHEPDGRARRIASVCIHARTAVPESDNMLAKKFLLETDEDAFRRIGNFSP
jgi:hypothetical protein